MLKLGCNSRERIIDFIEQSGALPLIREHYNNLHSDILFVKSLKAIEVHVKAKKMLCMLICDQKVLPNYMTMINSLIKHLMFLNIETKITSKNETSVDADHTSRSMFLLSILSKEEYNAQQGAAKTCASNDKQRSYVESNIYIRLNKPIYVNENQNTERISGEFYACPTYYDSVFTILQRLYPTHNLDAFISDFNTHYASLQYNKISIPNDVDINAQTEVATTNNRKYGYVTCHDITSFFFNYHRVYVFFSVLFFAIVLLFVVEHKRDKSKTISSYTKINQFIRSDLRVPVKSAFLDRPILIKQLNDHFKKETQNKKIKVVGIAGLIGIGGAGKTTLARTYAKSQMNSVVWEINAETHTSLIDSFVNLAYALAHTKELKDELTFIKDIQNAEEKKMQIVSFVKNQLNNKPKWLLIYDNVEDFSQIKEFFPHDVTAWGEGDVIITTRDSNILNSTHIGEANVIQIDQLNTNEALTLFCKILYQKKPQELAPEEEKRVRIFMTKIPPFPLDVSVAAYYIKNASLTLDQYGERIAQNIETFDKGQQAFMKNISDYTKTRYGLITLTIRKLIETNSEYKDLLFLICLLDSQNIPLNLLSFYKDHTLVDQFIRDLKRYSLITVTSASTFSNNTGIFTIHRSTQTLGKEFLFNILTKEEKDTLFKKFISCINSFYKYFINHDKTSISLFIPHLKVFLENVENIELDNKNQYIQDVLYFLGYSYMNTSRNLSLERKYLSRVYQLQEQTMRLTSFESALLLKELADICVDLGNRLEAISYAKKGLSLCINISDSQILAATFLKVIGYAYTYENNFQLAYNAFQEALQQISKLDHEIKKEVESSIYANIGHLYSSMHVNRSNEGVEYVKKALRILDGESFYYENSSQNCKNISCSIAKYKTFLGVINLRLGEFNESLKYYKDAQFIIDQSLDNCPHNMLKIFIMIGVGEIYGSVASVRLASVAF